MHKVLCYFTVDLDIYVSFISFHHFFFATPAIQILCKQFAYGKLNDMPMDLKCVSVFVVCVKLHFHSGVANSVLIFRSAFLFADGLSVSPREYGERGGFAL